MRIVGIVMIASLFVGLYFVIASISSAKEAAIAFGGATVVIVYCAVAAKLIVYGKP